MSKLKLTLVVHKVTTGLKGIKTDSYTAKYLKLSMVQTITKK